ncbi:MAG: hypothetical protein AB8B57_08115 [Congregibacter sp.]
MSILQALGNRSVFQSLRNTTLAVTGSACTIGGLVADVLQPIAPFASYLFYLAFFAFAVLLVLYQRGKEDLLGAVAFAGVASGIFGLIVLFQSGDDSGEVGFVATTVPVVASLQISLGIIDAKLDAIADDTASLKVSAKRLEDNSERVLRTLEEMRSSFASGGVIDRPRSPEDFYQNARLHELAGDYSAARRSYLEYFRADLPLLDPHLRFLAFLKVQEGTAGARETYYALMQGKVGGVQEYVRNLLLETPQRIAGIAAYADNNPDYAPAYYHLSLEYSLARLGSQTLAARRAEKAWLTKFQAADDAGDLLKHVIDQSLVDEWRNDASMRLQSINAMGDGVLDKPVSMTWGVNNSGYTGTVTIAEPALELLWNIRDEGEPRSTGESGAMSPQTGKPAPQLFISLPASQPDATLELRYRDANNELQGPFNFAFAGGKQSEDANRRVLEATTSSWLSFRDYDGKRLLYFTHLMSYRGSIESIHYAVNNSDPIKQFRFPVWRSSGLAPIDETTPTYITVPRSTRYVTVQITYKDASQSDVQRFDYVRH